MNTTCSTIPAARRVISESEKARIVDLAQECEAKLRMADFWGAYRYAGDEARRYAGYASAEAFRIAQGGAV